MVKAKDLRKKGEEDLVKDLNEFRKQLSEMKLNKVSSSHQVKLSKIRTVRKDIARVLTSINQLRKSAAREECKKAKFLHQDLRNKKTRAIRRRLTKFERTRHTLKWQKKHENFPQRVFAVSE
jgi:large subunit ribosomal protein L35e